MAAIDDKITKLETQLKQAKAQRQKVEARKRAATSKMTRQQDTRKNPRWCRHPRQSGARRVAERKAARHAGNHANPCR